MYWTFGARDSAMGAAAALLVAKEGVGDSLPGGDVLGECYTCCHCRCLLCAKL